MKSDNRLFIDGIPFQVVQNLVTAIDPNLLTEHTMMLLFHDLARLLPAEELPHRFVEVMAQYFVAGDDDDTEVSTH